MCQNAEYPFSARILMKSIFKTSTPRWSCLALCLGLCSMEIGGAAAQNGQVGKEAWCVDMASLGGYLECHYHTYSQCAAAARGVTNICSANSYYVPTTRQRPPQRREPHR